MGLPQKCGRPNEIQCLVIHRPCKAMDPGIGMCRLRFHFHLYAALRTDGERMAGTLAQHAVNP